MATLCVHFPAGTYCGLSLFEFQMVFNMELRPNVSYLTICQHSYAANVNTKMSQKASASPTTKSVLILLKNRPVSIYQSEAHVLHNPEQRLYTFPQACFILALSRCKFSVTQL